MYKLITITHVYNTFIAQLAKKTPSSNSIDFGILQMFCE